MLQAAGVLIVSEDGQALFLKRSKGGDHAGEWCFPGGKVEDGETIADAAIREVKEEIGFTIEALGLPHARRVSDGVDFTTYLFRVKEEFIPRLNDEHSAYAWAPPDDPPQPLHPGCAVALRRVGMDELGVAQEIAAGELASPLRYENMSLFDMRITGTGVSYRKALDEFVYRRPENYLTPEFLQRCNGLPVIWMHPEKSVLDSKEFGERVIGTMLWPYIKGDEVWGVAKIFDAESIKKMEEKQLSTSPAVVFRDPSVNNAMKLEDGTHLLVEGKPSLLDHLAVCENGVWDKGEEPNGIRIDAQPPSARASRSIPVWEKPDVKKKLDSVLFASRGLFIVATIRRMR